MVSWREALSGGVNTKRNMFLGMALLFLFLGNATKEKVHYVAFFASLILFFLMKAKLEWSWEFPSRVKAGNSFKLKITLKNKAFSKSIFQGDLIRNLIVRVKAEDGLRVSGKAKKQISELLAGTSKEIDFTIKTFQTLEEDLYGFTVKVESTAGKSEKYFEIYVKE